MTEWLGTFSYGTEERGIENCVGLAGNAMGTLSKWVPFSNQGRIRKQKERDEPHLSFAMPKIY